MAIQSSGGGTGIIIDSAAKDSRLTAAALGSQTGAASNQVIVPNAIGTNNEGNLEASPTYVGRLIIVRPGQRNEEIRLITADASNTLTVHEPWTEQPASGDDWALSYIIQDVATVTGMSLLTKRVSDYGSSRRIRIGWETGTAAQQFQFAWLALLGGVSLETNDNSSAALADVRVVDNGYLTNGYRAGGRGVSGGYIIGTPAVDGEMAFEVTCEKGGRADLYDFFLTHVASAQTQLFGSVRIQNGKVFAGSNPVRICATDTAGSRAPASLGYLQFLDFTIEGRGASGEDVFVDHFTRTDDLVIVSTNGIEHDTTNSWEVVLARVTWVQNNRLMGVKSDNRFKIVDPSWSVDDLGQSDIVFESTTNDPNVQERYTLDVTVTEPDGTAIAGAAVYVTEDLSVNDVVESGVTDADGLERSLLLKRQYENRAAATSRGPITTPNGFDFVDNGASNDTLVRNDAGSWLTDGYEVDGPVTVTSAENSANDGTFRILAVTASTIEVAPGTFTDTTDDNSAIISAAASVNRNLRDNFAVKAYAYGRQGFVAPVSAANGEDFPGTLPSFGVSLALDGNVSAATLALALSNPVTDPAYSRHGVGETDTQPLKVIAYDGGTGGLPTEGEVITIDNAGADTTGNLVEIIGDAVSGVMVLENWNGTEPENNVTATGGSSTFSVTTDTTGGASSFNEEYTILVDCNDESLQTTYDFERGVMAKPGKLSDYRVPRQPNAPLLHRTAANEWYGVVQDKRGRVQVIRSSQDFGANLLEDVDWEPLESPFFVLSHFPDGRDHQDDAVPFGLWSHLDGTTLHVMTVTFAGITTYHQFNTSTDTWSVQNEFVAQAWDFLASGASAGDPRLGLCNRALGAAAFSGDGSQGVAFSVRSDGDVVAMVPAMSKPSGAGTLGHRVQYRVMTRESGVWTDRGEITSTNDDSAVSPVVLMDTSDVASCIWGTGNGSADDIRMRTIDGTNSLGSEQTIDATADAAAVSNSDPWRLGQSIIDGSDNIYVPYLDADGNVTVATWASTTGAPTVTLRTGLNGNAVNRPSQFTFPFNSYGCLDDGTNIQMAYVDSSNDVLVEPNVDSAGADTTLHNIETVRQIHPTWDPDTSDVLMLMEFTPDTFTTERNIRSLAVQRDVDEMVNGALLDARNLILNWGQAEHAFLLKTGATGFFTDRNVANQEGVWVANRGVGTVAFLTSDSGATFTPPVTVTLSVTIVDAAGDPVQNARVGIYSDPEGPSETELMNELTNASGLATESFNYTVDTPVSVRVRKGSAADNPKYIPENTSQTITSSGLTVTITLREDPVNSA